MAEKIIGLKLVLKGADDAADEMELLTGEVGTATEELEKFLKLAKKFQTVDREISKLNKSLSQTKNRLKEINALLKKGGLDPDKVRKLGDETDKLTAKQKRGNQALKTNLNSAADLRRELKKSLAAGIEGYDALIPRIAKLKANQEQVNQKIREQSRAFKASSFKPGSYDALNHELVELRRNYKRLSKEEQDGFPGRQMLKRIGVLDTQVKGIDGKMGNFQRNVGNYASAWQGVGKAMGAIAGPLGIAVTVEAVIGKLVEGIAAAVSLNVEFSDSFADVRKTTGLTAKGIDELFDVLKTLDSRTSLADLLDISRIGGQLGIAEEELAGFTESVDKLVVSLGDELGGDVEEIAGNIGKLNDVFRVSNELGVSGGINAIGSAINSLGQAGTARASFLVDFSQRLGGIAPAAKISIQEVLGLAAAFDEGGQSAEVSSTALIQILGLIGKDVPKFAEIAGKSVDEFNEILNVSGNDALLAVLEGAGQTEGGLASLGETLLQFGVKGARVSQVLGFMVNNIDLVKEKQALANDEFEKGTSLTDEFNVKNATASAEIDKLKKNIQALFIDSGFQEFLARMVRGINEVITSSEVWREEWKEVGEGLRLLFAPIKFLFGLFGKLLRWFGLFNEETNGATLWIKAFSRQIQYFNPFVLLLKGIGKASFAIQALVKRLKELSNTFFNTEFDVSDKTAERQAETIKKTREAIIDETKKTTEALAAEEKKRRKAAEEAAAKELADLEKNEAAKEEARKKAEEKRKKREEETARAGANIRKLEVEAIEDPFEKQKAQARLEKDTAISSLVGTDEQKLAQRELIEEAFTDRLVSIEEERATSILNTRKEAEEKAIEARQEAYEKRIEEEDARFEEEKLRLVEQLREKKEINTGKAEGGEISFEEAEALNTELEEEQRLLEIETERNHLLAKAQLMEEFGLNTIALQQQIAEKEIAINDQKNKDLKAKEVAAQNQRKAVLASSLGHLSSFVGGVKSLLSKDEENRKKYGAVIKAAGIAEIAINLAKELSAIAAAAAANPTNAVTFGAAGSAQYAIQSIIAIVRAGIATASIIKQKLEYGGAIPTSDLPQAQASTVLAPPHHDGGKTYQIGNSLMELEGGEMFYKNGPETYILNKKSAKKFGHLVRKDKRPTTKYYSDRKLLASKINSFNGWGIPLYQSGGVASTFTPNISPQSAPVTPFAENLTSQGGDSGDLANEVANQTIATRDLVDATNRRMDRLEVIVDPVAIVRAALESGEIKIGE